MLTFKKIIGDGKTWAESRHRLKRYSLKRHGLKIYMGQTKRIENSDLLVIFFFGAKRKISFFDDQKNKKVHKSSEFWGPKKFRKFRIFGAKKVQKVQNF